MFTHKQRFAPRLGVGAHHRVHHWFHCIHLGLRQLGPPRVARAQVFVFDEVRVLGTQRRNGGLQRIGQGLIGGVLVGKQRVAALRGQLLRMQHRPQAGFVHIRQVGVPEMARVAQANRRTVLFDVGDDQDLGMARKLKILEHMDLQRAEPAAEVHLLLRCDALVAEHQYVVVQMGAVDTGKVGCVERQRQIQPQHLGPHRRRQGTHREILPRNDPTVRENNRHHSPCRPG